MKRLFLLMALLSLFLITWAQRPLVTLSHDGELSFFSTLSALEDAVEAAQDGDIIYLSEGQFTCVADTLKILKRLSIVGCGYSSQILNHVKVDLTGVTAPEMDKPLFEGLQMRGLRFESVPANREKSNNVTIRNCKMEYISRAGFAAKNFLIDKCYITDGLYCQGSSESNVTVQNSKINSLSSQDYTQYIFVINCNVGSLGYLPKITIGSILGYSLYGNGSSYNYETDKSYAIYYSLISAATASNVYRENTYGIDFEFENLEVDVDFLRQNNLFGQDGTVIGIHGGESPFSENPSVPTVDSEKSSVEYDADSNKLKVTITVKPN